MYMETKSEPFDATPVSQTSPLRQQAMPAFVEPVKNAYTIYTKTNCKFCEKTMSLFSDIGETPLYVNCDGYLEAARDDFIAFIRQKAGREYRTFPMIFSSGEFIGGYTDLTAHINKLYTFT
jgi:glutaredoxin